MLRTAWSQAQHGEGGPQQNSKAGVAQSLKEALLETLMLIQLP